MSEINNNIFAQATRKKYRFYCTKGILSVEDLWDLPLVSLNELAKGYHRKLQDNEVSFIEDTSSNIELKNLFDIVKAIIDVKLAEKEIANSLAEKALKRKKLLEILASKEDESLHAMSQEQILKELDALE